VALGYPAPPLGGQEGVYSPFDDPEATTPEQLYEKFKQWISSYFKHPDISSGLPAGMSFAKGSEKRTLSLWSEEEMAKWCDSLSAATSDILAFVYASALSASWSLTQLDRRAPPMQATRKVQTDKALFDPNLVTLHFPKVNIFYVCGEETAHYCMWAYMESSRLYKEALGRGEIVRPTKFKLLPERNHFVSAHICLLPC
jgi:hypothetical protein